MRKKIDRLWEEARPPISAALGEKTAWGLERRRRFAYLACAAELDLAAKAADVKAGGVLHSDSLRARAAACRKAAEE